MLYAKECRKVTENPQIARRCVVSRVGCGRRDGNGLKIMERKEMRM